MSKHPRDFLLIALGSHGDVHPFVGVGRGLKARGHRVRIAANDAFATMIRNAGLTFVSAGDAETFEQVKNDPDVWHATRGPQRVMAFVGRTLRDVYDMVLRECDPHTCIVGSTLALGARCAADKFGYPMATVHLAPICIRTSAFMPALPGGFMDLNRLPMWLRRRFWAAADRFFIDPLICPVLNKFRAEIGLPRVTRMQAGWWHAPLLTIGLWPSWFFPAQPDYPQQVRLAAFPLYDESDHTSLDPSLASWLDAGSAPIAFTPGSAMMFGDRFFQSAVDACVRMDRRGILLTRHPEQIPKNLPTTVWYEPFAPFGLLLPRCAAAVHHGGIGSTAQGLKAGIPQLIMPMSHDQFDNAQICRRLGVADVLPVRKFTGDRVAAKLTSLIESESVRRSCAESAEKARADDAVAMVCTLLESAMIPV
ncbi:MAG: glycosyltransferase family 1 protein [Akkermansiaceae bacterium]|nr:glycosyltransferase family 1 protein [Verrucomicrobiales bacterium]